MDGRKQGHAPCNHLTPKILRTFEYCMWQLAGKFEWAASVNLKNDVSIPNAGAWRYSLQYDRRPDWCFEVLFEMWRIGSLSGREEEMCEWLIKRMVDVCSLQEERWIGLVSMMLGWMEGDLSCGGLEIGWSWCCGCGER